METTTAFLSLCLGLLLRLALPIAVTLTLAHFLHKLDAKWQKEVSLERVPIQKRECWETKGCSLEQRKNCIAFNSPLPCWQAFRLSKGHLSEECISCKVFIDAPPLKIEPRRM